MDKIYTLPLGFNPEYSFQDNPELLDIGQIEPFFNSDEFKINIDSPSSPSVIATELKRSMNMHFLPVSNSSYDQSNSADTSPEMQTSNDSPAFNKDMQDSCLHSYDYELNNQSGFNRFKRGCSSSPGFKKKIHYANNFNQNSDYTNEGIVFEDDEPLEYDEFYNDVKEEKLFNDPLTNIISLNEKNYKIDNFYKNINDLKQRNNSDLIYNLKNDEAKNNLKGKNIKSISFSYWNEDTWAGIYNEKFEEIEPPVFRVEADKGFFYSQFDEAFICQKKNHFQITTHTFMKTIPVFCKKKSDSQFYKVDKFILQLYGIKQESPLQKIQIKQSDSDRKPVDYQPVECKFMPEQSNKCTKMRLHFAHTTNNNNRKRNKNGLTVPNPDQRYFLLVVEIQILTDTGKIFTMCSSASEKVIVRAVNPGQFKQEICEENLSHNKLNIKLNSPNENSNLKTTEQKHSFHGKVGINTTDPDEALTILGNLKLSGNILQPSDVRVKENIEPVDTNRALENVSKLKLYKYDYKKEFTHLNGGLSSDYGILAQHVQQIIPEAVVPTGDLILSDGQIINNFLNVNKNRIHMECVGAVIALDDKTKNLDKKIEKIEQIINEKGIEYGEDFTDCSKRSGLDQSITIAKHNHKEKKDNKYACLMKKKFFKFIIAFSILIIAFGIIGILIVQILHHTKISRVFENNSESDDSSHEQNHSFFYPKLMPPPVMSPNCNKSVCRFCCLNSKNSKVRIDAANTSDNELVKTSLHNLPEKRLHLNSTNSNLNAKALLKNPVIYVNLTLSSACTIPYCEEINGVNYFFVPISSNVDTKIQFYLAFFLKQGFMLRNCNVQKNGQLCPNTKFDSSIFRENDQATNSTLNIYKDIFNYSKKYVFYAPITYFLHIDFVFRIFMESTEISSDICSFPSYNLNSKNYLFKEYVFRFYRLC